MTTHTDVAELERGASATVVSGLTLKTSSHDR